jgi:hypothetical protein
LISRTERRSRRGGRPRLRRCNRRLGDRGWPNGILSQMTPKEIAWSAFAKGAAVAGNRDVGDLIENEQRGLAIFEAWWREVICPIDAKTRTAEK